MSQDLLTDADKEVIAARRQKKTPLPMNKPDHVIDSIRARKEYNLALIRNLGLPIKEEGSMINISVAGRKIDLWPGSDTYFSHTKNEWGTGISMLVEKIRPYLTTLKCSGES